MLNLNLFAFETARDARRPGDKASSQSVFLWTVETFDPTTGFQAKIYDTFKTRAEARRWAKSMRDADRRLGDKRSFRVIPYKACLDRKGRINRQIRSERLDY